MSEFYVYPEDEEYKEYKEYNEYFEPPNYLEKLEKLDYSKYLDNKTIKLLDTIIFTTSNSKELLKARILEITHFNTLIDAINDPHLYINDLTPDIDNIDDAIDIYNDILSYENNINNINNNGLIRYKFELI